MDLFSLQDKVIAITGGAQGIGLALAFACAEVGARVAVIDAKPEPHKDYYILKEQCSQLAMYQYVAIPCLVMRRRMLADL